MCLLSDEDKQTRIQKKSKTKNRKKQEEYPL